MIIPIFIPQGGCPHQCVFCNQHVITNQNRIPTPFEIREKIKKFLQYAKTGRQVQVAFFGGNFLGLPARMVTNLLETAGEFIHAGKVECLRFSTRPDTINAKTLELLTDYPDTIIEIGVQSMHDSILELCQRGHTVADTIAAVECLHRANFKIGIQIMVGLPGGSHALAIASAHKIVALKPTFVRIYPAIVLANSPLAQQYYQGTYTPLSLKTSVDWVKDIYLIFQKANITVIRMGLQTEEGLEDAIIAGPFHPAFGHLVFDAVFLDAAYKLIKTSNLNKQDSIHLKVHPCNLSKMRGLKNRNLKVLQKKFQAVLISGDYLVPLDEIKILKFMRN